jgi:hypothetical protein
VILATALASAAIAFAGPAPAPATMQGDLAAAATYWQQPVAAHCSSESISSAAMPGRVLGEATVPDLEEQSEPCMMKINSGMTHRLRCLVVVHEYGHWLGLDHSTNRKNPMFPIIEPTLVVPECEHA